MITHESLRNLIHQRKIDPNLADKYTRGELTPPQAKVFEECVSKLMSQEARMEDPVAVPLSKIKSGNGMMLQQQEEERRRQVKMEQIDRLIQAGLADRYQAQRIFDVNPISTVDKSTRIINKILYLKI